MRARRIETAIQASQARHLRSIAREGDEGMRCYDCNQIPLHPWEVRMGGMG